MGRRRQKDLSHSSQETIISEVYVEEKETSKSVSEKQNPKFKQPPDAKDNDFIELKPKIQVFKGLDDKVTIHNWLKRYEMLSEYFGWDERRKIIMLGNYLEDDALNWYIENCVNINFEQTKESLVERFGIPVVEPIVEFMNLKYDINTGLDTISDFKLRISKEFKIEQFLNENKKVIIKEIVSNYSRNVIQEKILQNENGLKCNFDQIGVNLSEYKNERINQNDEDILSEKEKIDIKSVLTEFHDVFAKDKFDVGSINIETCKINLTNNVPINLRPYRCSQIDQEKIDAQIKVLLEKGLIRKSISPYSFPVTLADKKDEGKRSRLCIDYRKLNQYTIADNYPFPRIEDIVDKIHGSKYFTKLDIASGFLHILIEKSDIHKTAFVTMNEHFEWLVMPFGFRNAPSIFQRIIYSILKKHNLTKFAHNYLDDILIHSKSFKEHIKHIKLVLSALLKENVKLKLSKCDFAKSKVEYLGHIISENRISPLNDNLISIKEFPRPISIKSVQQFLGKVNYYHKFIPNAPKLLAPLYKLLKKNEQFKWCDNCENSFNLIKDYLISSPILRIYDPNAHCYIFTDASKIGIGAVLKQKDENGNMHPVAYFSKKLLSYQQNYSITEIECLAIVEAINFWHHYLYGKNFTVITDHNALKWLKSVKKPNSRLFNWSLKLSQYDFNIKYEPGKNNVEADCLSRNPIERNECKEHVKVVNLLTKDEILEAQKEWEKNKEPIPKKCFKLNDLIVKHKNMFTKVFVPQKLKLKLIENFHLKFGHLGKNKMIKLMSTCYFWQSMCKDIKSFVDSCDICQTNKLTKVKKLGTLSQIGPAKEPLEIVSIDTIGGFANYNSNKQYIHVAIDNFTRFVWCLASKTQNAKDFINLIKSVMNVSKPKQIIADRYTGINSNEFKNFLCKNDMKIQFITTNCPQSNGICERVNQTLTTRLRCKINDNNHKKCWPKLLELVVEEYNNSPHNVTQFTPKYLLFGLMPFEPIAENYYPSLNEAREIAFKNSEIYHKYNKLLYDNHHLQQTLKVGDLVLIENKNKISRKKLDPVMVGPFKIVKKLSEISYEVECDKKGRETDVFHISKLRLYQKCEHIT
ncbi:Retrotransposable element Tf2 protein type 1-like protein [Dinothrombium tinctorium]|uniref:RNA-directed DNA polymerase n=1 Tax=Dinothrombium tinctorium TaxID=1965070 RepID=A0A3S3P5T4_9ACAR|nr:Retrotransposable element Tf2 protein type 1-like protein [Dinothrombium tinctorium]